MEKCTLVSLRLPATRGAAAGFDLSSFFFSSFLTGFSSLGFTGSFVSGFLALSEGGGGGGTAGSADSLGASAAGAASSLGGGGEADVI